MKHSDFVQEVSGSGPAYFQSWLPSKNPVALMLVIHGFGEHSSRYGTHFMEYFTKSDIGVYGFDLPGHGKSFGKRGHIHYPTILLEIIDNLIKKMKLDFPNLPIFIYGHSFGGEVGLWYTLVRNPAVNGVIITSPLIGPKHDVPSWKLFLAKVMDSIMPAFSMTNGINPKFLSRDPEVVRKYLQDPMVHDKISARSGMMVINRGKWILENAASNMNNMLLMAGSEEGVVNKEAIDQFYRKAPNVQYKIWSGLYHELHNEPEKVQVFDYALEWIKQNS